MERIRYLSKRLMTSKPLEESPMDELGPEVAMVHVRRNAVILRFPLEDSSGIVVSLNSESAESLHALSWAVGGGYHITPYDAPYARNDASRLVQRHLALLRRVCRFVSQFTAFLHTETLAGMGTRVQRVRDRGGLE